MEIGKIDLKQLSEKEAKVILEVLNRDSKLRCKEKERIKKLHTEIQTEKNETKDECEEEKKIQNDNICQICGKTFIWLIRPKIECAKCSKFSCKNNTQCTNKIFLNENNFNGVQWICKLCNDKTSFYLKSSEWFYSQKTSKFGDHATSTEILQKLNEFKDEDSVENEDDENENDDGKELEKSLVRSLDGQLKHKDHIRSDEDHLTSDKDHVRSDEDHLRSDKDHVRSDEEIIEEQTKSSSSSNSSSSESIQDEKENNFYSNEVVESEETGYITEERDTKLENLEEILINILKPQMNELKSVSRENVYILVENFIESYPQRFQEKSTSKELEDDTRNELMSRYLHDHKQYFLHKILKTIQEPGELNEARITVSSTSSRITHPKQDESPPSEIESSFLSSASDIRGHKFRASIIRSRSPRESTKNGQDEDSIRMKQEKLKKAELHSLFTEISPTAEVILNDFQEFETDIQISDNSSSDKISAKSSFENPEEIVIEDSNWEVQRKDKKPHTSQRFLPEVETPSAYEGLTSDESSKSSSENIQFNIQFNSMMQDACIQTTISDQEDIKLLESQNLTEKYKLNQRKDMKENGNKKSKSYNWTKLKPQKLNKRFQNNPKFESTPKEKNLKRVETSDSLDLYSKFIMNRSISSSSSNVSSNKEEKLLTISKKKSAESKPENYKEKPDKKLYPHLEHHDGDPTKMSRSTDKLDAVTKVKAWMKSSSSSIDTCSSDQEPHLEVSLQENPSQVCGLAKMKSFRSFEIPQVKIIEDGEDLKDRKSITRQTSIFDKWGDDNGLNYEYKIEKISEVESSSEDESYIDLVNQDNFPKISLNQRKQQLFSRGISIEDSKINKSLDKLTKSEIKSENKSFEKHEAEKIHLKISMSIPTVVVKEKEKSEDILESNLSKNKQSNKKNFDECSTTSSAQSSRNFSIRSLQRENRLELQSQGRNLDEIIKELRNAGMKDVKKNSTNINISKNTFSKSSASNQYKSALGAEKSFDSILEEDEKIVNSDYNEWAKTYNFATETKESAVRSRAKNFSHKNWIKKDIEQLEIGASNQQLNPETISTEHSSLMNELFKENQDESFSFKLKSQTSNKTKKDEQEEVKLVEEFEKKINDLKKADSTAEDISRVSTSSETSSGSNELSFERKVITLDDSSSSDSNQSHKSSRRHESEEKEEDMNEKISGLNLDEKSKLILNNSKISEVSTQLLSKPERLSHLSSNASLIDSSTHDEDEKVLKYHTKSDLEQNEISEQQIKQEDERETHLFDQNRKQIDSDSEDSLSNSSKDSKCQSFKDEDFFQRDPEDETNFSSSYVSFTQPDQHDPDDEDLEDNLRAIEESHPVFQRPTENLLQNEENVSSKSSHYSQSNFEAEEDLDDEQRWLEQSYEFEDQDQDEDVNEVETSSVSSVDKTELEEVYQEEASDHFEDQSSNKSTNPSELEDGNRLFPTDV